MIRIPSRLADWLLWHCVYRTIYRPPDVRIGEPGSYSLLRWWLTPRIWWLPKLYFHQMLRDDDDRALHDHPSFSLSLVLTDDLGEVYQTAPPDGPVRFRRFRKGQLVWRSASAGHRLTVTKGRDAFTLFMFGPDIREWGFLCPQGWRKWRDYAKPMNDDGGGYQSGRVGRGCGE